MEVTVIILLDPDNFMILSMESCVIHLSRVICVLEVMNHGVIRASRAVYV